MARNGICKPMAPGSSRLWRRLLCVAVTLMLLCVASFGQNANPKDDQPAENAAGKHVEAVKTQPSGGDQNEPEAVHQQSPYPGLPSLEDLYTQEPSSQIPVRRFGENIFQAGTGNADQLPMDLPAGPDYVLGPGDGLTLNIWGSVSQRVTGTVDRQGQLALPDAGVVVVAGQTITQAQEIIQRALARQFKDVKVELSLSRLHTVRVYVVGEVQRPGAYDISSLSTPLNALYAAGGVTSRGSLRIVRHYRGKDLLREVDLYEFLLHGVRSDVERLQSGDTILVPPVGRQVTVMGMVRRPAIYELRQEQQLSEVLDLAGGVLVSAALRQINVERIEAHEKRVMLSLDLPQTDDNAILNKALAAFHVQDGDRIHISQILPYSEKTVYLQGHVFHPGKYPYRDGLTVSDLLRSYQDILPEPAAHAELIRLQPPDFRPTLIEFNLSNVLSGDEQINLQQFDTVRVFSRYEIDAPKVSIYGEVLRPGEYPLGRGMTCADLVRMAGGFRRSAYKDLADLSSYTVQNGQRVLTKQSTVEIEKALEGDKGVDVALNPGDVLSIRQLTGWEDIGAAVTIKGEVRYPGTYGIKEGERLSSVLKRAGAFRESAYPTGAVLERVQVKEMAGKTKAELIRRIETTGATLKMSPAATGAPDQLAMYQSMQQQQQQVLASLRTHPVTGRMVIKISAGIEKWANTPADIEMRAGDVLVIPKRPDFVLVSGQVYNSSAITYAPGKTAEWYLRQSGGPTDMANKKSIFILRADGSVVGEASGRWVRGDVLSVRLQPGDSIVVPEKVIGGSMFWRNLMATAQLMTGIGLTAAVAAGI